MLKKCKRRTYALFAGLLICCYLPIIAYAKSGKDSVDVSAITAISGTTASYNWDDGGTSAGNGSGSAIVNNGTIECTAISRGTMISGGATTLNLTLTNDSGTTKTLEFNVNYLNNGSNIASVTVANVSAADGYRYSGTLNDGDSVTISLKTTSKRNTQYTAKISLSNFDFYSDNQVTVTFGDANNDQAGKATGSYTVNGKEPTSGTYSGNAVTGLAVSPEAGYRFQYWVTSDGTVLGSDPSQFTKPDNSTTVSPYFVPANAAIYKVGGKFYFYWNDAVTAAVAGDKKIILEADGTLPGSANYNFTGAYAVKNTDGTMSYSLPSGVTLLIPFDATDMVRGVPSTVTAYGIGMGVIGNLMPPDKGLTVFADRDKIENTLYRTLTMASGAHITVNGALEVSGQTDCYPYGARTPVRGNYSEIQMESGSSITVNNVLYAWGHIRGNGTITVKPGANVYGNMNILDYMGDAGVMNDINKAGAFPLREFYMDAVQVPMTMEYGSNVRGFYCIYGNLIGYNTFIVDLVGSDGIFKSESGDLRFYYQNGRQKVDIFGQSSFNNMYIELTVDVPIIGTITGTVDSSKTSGLPVGSKWDVVLKSNAILTLNESAVVFAGASFTMEEGSNFIVSTGKKAYFLDAATDPSNVEEDAYVDFSGTVTVNGELYCGSNNRALSATGNGKVIVTKVGADTKVKLRNPSDKVSEYDIVPALLGNNDGTYVSTDTTGTYNYSIEHGRWILGEHSLTDIVTDPTCTEDGYTSHTCTCGYGYTDSVITAAGHTFSGSTGNCNVCGTPMAIAAIWSDSAATYYQTLGAALGAPYDSSTDYIQMLADTDESVTITGIVNLDLNGHTIAEVTVSGTLNGMDTANNDFSSTPGSITKLSIDGGSVSEVYQYNLGNLIGKQYIACPNGDSISFHRFDMGVKQYTFYKKGDTGTLVFDLVFKGDDAAFNEIFQTGACITGDGQTQYTWRERAREYSGNIQLKKDYFSKVITVKAAVKLNEGDADSNAILGDKYFANDISLQALLDAKNNGGAG